MDNMKGKTFKGKISGVKHIFLIAIPFILIDIFVRFIASGINYFQSSMIAPNIIFNIIWSIIKYKKCDIAWISMCFFPKYIRLRELYYF